MQQSRNSFILITAIMLNHRAHGKQMRHVRDIARLARVMSMQFESKL